MKIYLFIYFLVFTLNSNSENFWSFIHWTSPEKAPEFNEMKDINELKETFFNYLLPEIKRKNKEILEIRKKIREGSLPKHTLKQLHSRYLVEEGNVSLLLDKIDIIPASLVLSQAALESNWGRSRFAKFYNNYFGLWCFKKGCGVIPKQRAKDATHEVAKFSTLQKGLDYYFLSINRNKLYETFRKIRKEMRHNKKNISGLSLSEGLSSYAEIGYDYVERIKKIIRVNELVIYDRYNSL